MILKPQGESSDTFIQFPPVAVFTVSDSRSAPSNETAIAEKNATPLFGQENGMESTSDLKEIQKTRKRQLLLFHFSAVQQLS